MKAQEITIYTTDDYTIFKRLKGNRAVTSKRIAIIKASFEAIGYISNPIICNERMEIIDGQGRYEVCKQLGMPVEYRIISGIGIDECRAMNLKPTAWKLQDFIESYAEYGVDGYIRLKELQETYGFGYQLLFAFTDNRTLSGRQSIDIIKNGSFKLTEEKQKEIAALCEYLQGFKDIQKRIGGRHDAFYGCVAWCSKRPGVDKERLKVSMHQQISKLSPVARTEPTLKEISDVYNCGYQKKNRRDFVYEWKFAE